VSKLGPLEKNIKEMISFGGGINSTAMTILLVNEGWQGPIVFADTGGEWPETYCYMDYFEDSFLKSRDLEITRLVPPSCHHRDGQGFLEDYCREHRTIPFAATRWCTVRWKIHPINGYMRERGMGERLLAIDAGEARRAKARDGYTYPLVERGIDRRGCRGIILGSGLDLPHRSSCFFCPFQKPGQWRELHEIHPGLYERAANLERLATERRDDGRTAKLDPWARFTLDELRRKFEAQMELPGFEYEYLREFQGCVCGL